MFWNRTCHLNLPDDLFSSDLGLEFLENMQKTKDVEKMCQKGDTIVYLRSERSIQTPLAGCRTN